MMGAIGDWRGAAVVVGGWLLTYLIHSTVLLGAAALITKVVRAGEAFADVVWKAALAGGLVTSLVVVAAGVRPLARSWVLEPDAAALRRVETDGTRGVEASGVVSETSNASDEVHTLSERGLRAPELSGESVSDADSHVEDSNNAARGAGLRLASAAVAATWIWVSCALVMVVVLALRRRNLFSMLGRRVPVKAGLALDTFEGLRHAALIRRRVRLTSSPACPVPLALTSSEVCVPDWFLVELDAEEQRGALAHEVAHLARRDPTWLTFAMAMEAVMFFQPLNRLARRQLKESAEYLCDEWAAGEGAGLGLARCLERVAAWLRPAADPLLAATSAIAAGQSPLVRRVERLLTGQTLARRGRARMGFGLAATMMLLVVAAAPAVSVTRPTLVERPGVSPRVSGVREPGATQEVVVRAPRMQDAIGERWAWALSEARSRGYRRFWVVYAFDRPHRANEQYMSESGGLNLDEINWRGTPLRSVLGAHADRGTIAVMFHFGSASGDDAIDRIGHRSMTVPMDFGGHPVLWLGSAGDAESVAWLDRVRTRVQAVELQTEVVEAVAVHATSAVVLPVLERLLTSAGSDVVRAEAAEGLEYHDTSDSMRLAERTARNDASPTVRAEAAEALGGIDVAGATDVLVELALRGFDHGVRTEAAEALGEHAPGRALPALERLIFEVTDVGVGMEAVEAVGSVQGGSRLELLRRVIWEHPVTELRREAVETLEDVGSADVLGVLEDVLRRHPDEVVRKEAIDVLSSMDSPASRRILVERLSVGRSTTDRREVIEELAGARKDTRTAAEVQELARLLERLIFNDPDRGVRMEALEAVEELPRDVARTLLRNVIETHPDAGIRREAVDILGSMR